jgi:hypothetical protein
MIISLFIIIGIKENFSLFGTEVTLFYNKFNLYRPFFTLWILWALSLLAFARFMAFASAARACPNTTKQPYINEDRMSFRKSGQLEVA